MNTSADEYLSRTQTQTPGDTPAKVFRVAPAENPVKHQILGARDAALAMRELSTGARLLYVKLIDLSVQGNTAETFGSVAISESSLAEMLGCCVKTIYNRKRDLINAGLVWLTGKAILNAKHLDVYHVQAFDPKPTLPPRMEQNGLLMSRQGWHRPPCTMPRDPATGKFYKNGVSRKTLAVSAEIAGGTGKDLPLATANACRSLRQGLAAGTGNDLPQATATPCRSLRKELAVATGNDLPQATATDCRYLESETIDQRPGTVPLAFNGRVTPSKSASEDRKPTEKAPKEAPHGKLTAKRENIFLLDVSAMCDKWRKGHGKTELADSGGWWRSAFRADKNLMESVLAETLRAVKEGQIKETPGQYAVDLWKRWNGQIGGKEAL